MAHFSTDPGTGLAVQMETCPRYFERVHNIGRRVVQPHLAQEVHDRRRRVQHRAAQWQVADSAHELLELTGRASALGVVIRVVWSRREFVHQQRTGTRDETLHGQQSDNLKSFGNGHGQQLRARRHGVGDGGGRDGPRQNAIGVMIARRRIDGGFSRGSPRNEHADFVIDVDALFNQTGPGAQRLPRALGLIGRGQAGLTPSVIATVR